MKTILTIFMIAFCSAFQLQAQCPNASRSGVHVIQYGDDLYKIANLYQIELQDIMTWNQLGYNQPLMLCQELIVRNNSTTTEYTNSNPSNESFTSRGLYTKQSGKKHRVISGQTIAGLAELYGYSETRFREFNAMSTNYQLQPGDILLSSDCTCDRISYTNGETDHVGLAEKTNTSTIPTGTPPRTTAPKTNPPNTNAGSNEGTTSMTSQELDMVTEINLLRGNPSGYIQYVDAYVSEQRRTGGFPVDQAVVDELKSELRQLGPLSILTPSQCIYQAAKDHGIDQKPTGDVNHEGRDGSWPWDRVRKACPNMQDGNENLVAGTPSIRTAVILLLIDEGIPTRGHRKTLLKPEWRYVGCYNVGTVGTFPHYWVQNFGY